MKEAENILHAHGIKLRTYQPGQHYTTCPQCSAKRSKPHQRTKCLGVKIEINGRVIWHCNHCDWSGPKKPERTDSKIVPTYTYRDRDGVIRFGKVRNPPGADIKCWFCHPNGKGGWAKKLGGADASILYRINEVVAAIEAGQMICIVEGEKDADNLWRLGIAATCNAHGASEVGKKPKWTPAHAAQLAGADIVVFNDHDPPGYAHAETARKSLVGVAKRVRRLDLKEHWPQIPEGGDVSDWLALGHDHTPERLRELIERAPDYAPPEQSPPSPDEIEAQIERLAQFSIVEYERERRDLAAKLGMRPTILDVVVKAKRRERGLDGCDGKKGRALSYPEIEPWPEAVDGAALLDEIAAAAERFMILPEHGATVIALWPLHTHCLDNFSVTPRLQISAPDSECGKSTLLYVLNPFVYRPQNAVAVTPPLLFRLMEQFRPTLMFDEADTQLVDNEPLRAILDIGHHRYGEVCRLVGDDHEPRAFRAYGAIAYGMIGELSGKLRTLDSRSIKLRLKRKLATEMVEDFDIDRSPAELVPIARRIVRWIKDNREAIAAAKPPNVPLSNRRRDNWMPLFKIAEVAGGEWPKRVLAAATAKEEAARSRLEELLSDIRDVFDSLGRDRMSSAEVIEKLCEIPGRPWAEYGKPPKPLTQNKLAKLLKPLAVSPQLLRLPNSDDPVRGYQRSQFDEAFERYLSSEGVAQTVTALQIQKTRPLLNYLELLEAATMYRFKNHGNPMTTGFVTV
jgi:putative DNA primase/helicase